MGFTTQVEGYFLSLNRVLKGCVFVLGAFHYPIFADSIPFSAAPPPTAIQPSLTFKHYKNPVIATMSNQDLFSHAEQPGLSPTSSTQRELNKQWLENHAHDDVLQGGKALSKFLQRGFKSYWENQRQERFNNSQKVPDIYGRGQVNNSLEYDIKLKSDELRIGLSYEF